MPASAWTRIINQLADAGCKRISFTGGEPLLFDPLFDLAATAKELEIHLTLNSNGILVPKMINQIAASFNKVIISLDGDRATHDSARGTGSYDAVIAAAENLAGSRVPLEFYCVIGEHNHSSLEKVLDVADMFKTYVTFQPGSFESLSGEKNPTAIENETLRKSLEKLYAFKKSGRPVANSKTGLRSMMQWPQAAPKACYGHLLFCRIEPDGTMRICGRDPVAVDRPSVAEQPVAAAFHQLKQPACAVCGSAARLELNLVLRPSLEAVWNLIKRRF